MEHKLLGQPVVRKEGRDKVTGRAQYVDDLTLPGMIHGVTVRSSIARGRILGIHYASSIPWDEFIIVTAADIPRKNEIAAILHDPPCPARDFFNHPEDP